LTQWGLELCSVFEKQVEFKKLLLNSIYEIEPGVYHIGPVTKIAYHRENWHFSLALHAGFGF